MKKNNCFIKTLYLLSLTLFVGSIFSCSLDVSKESKLIRPDLEKTNSGIAIRLKYYSSDTEYITLYRQDITDLSEKDYSNATIEKIGLIFPKQFDAKDQTYFFEDSMVYKGKTYRYKARLMEENTPFETEWTDPYKAETGLTDNSLTISYELQAGTKIIYDSDYKTFAISGTFIPPTGIPDFSEYSPALVFKTSSGIVSSIKLTEKIVLSSSQQQTEVTPQNPEPQNPVQTPEVQNSEQDSQPQNPAQTPGENPTPQESEPQENPTPAEEPQNQVDILASGTKYKLTTLFTTDFYDTEIQFLGIVGQKEEALPNSTISNPKIKRVFWTNLKYVPLYKSGILADGSSNEEVPNNTFVLDNQTGEAGYDYS